MQLPMTPEQKLKAFKLVIKSTNQLKDSIYRKYSIGTDYYNNKNDITNNLEESAYGTKNDDTPLRNWNSQVSSNFHHILVNQKKNYLAGAIPTFDIDDDEGLNKKLTELLPDNFGTTVKQLVQDAALGGRGWLHLWFDQSTKKLRMAPVPVDQVTPIYMNTLNHELLGVRRTYTSLNEEGVETVYDEYWTETEVQYYCRPAGTDYEQIQLNNRITYADENIGAIVGEPTNVMKHGFNGIPFIEFRNNADATPDLQQYKGLIDSYDLVFNGFVNDVQDIQQVFLVLTNYGGTDLDEFMSELRDYKAIKVEEDEDGKGGVDKLEISIPVEARKTLLDLTRDKIYEHGQGYDPNKMAMGTQVTGVALKMMYGSLEMKVLDTESEFLSSLKTLIRMILNTALNGKGDDAEIKVTWPRTAIQNRSEDADIVSKLADISSKEAVAKSNPIVDDWQTELEDRENDQIEDEFTPDNSSVDGEEDGE